MPSPLPRREVDLRGRTSASGELNVPTVSHQRCRVADLAALHCRPQHQGRKHRKQTPGEARLCSVSADRMRRRLLVRGDGEGTGNWSLI